MRVNQSGAELLWRLVLAEETRLLTARRQWGEDEDLKLDLKDLRRVKDEIERVLTENDWGD